MAVNYIATDLDGKGVHAKLGGCKTDPVVLLVDPKILTCLHASAQGLPDYLLFRKKLVNFVEKFESRGVELHFYFDTIGGAGLGGYVDEQSRRTHEYVQREQNQNTSSTTGLPLLLMWEAQQVIEELGCASTYCFAESLLWLARDALDPALNPFAILGLDPQLFFIQNGARFIPYSSVGFDDECVTCQWYNAGIVAGVLGLKSSDHLHLVSALMGNNYTNPFLEDRNMGILGCIGLGGGTMKYSNVIAWANRHGEDDPLLLDICGSIPAFGQAVAYTKLVMTDPDAIISSIRDRAPGIAYYVQRGLLPTFAVVCCVDGWVAVDSSHESNTTCSSSACCLALLATVQHLLGVSSGFCYCRTGTQYCCIPISSHWWLPRDIYKGPSPINADLKLRLSYLYGPLTSFLSVRESIVSDELLQLLRLNVHAPVLSVDGINLCNIGIVSSSFALSVLGLMYLIASSAAMSDPLLHNEILALLLMSSILKVVPSSAYATTSSEANLRALSIASRYQAILGIGLYPVFMCVGLYPLPQPDALFHGPLFASLLTYLSSITATAANNSVYHHLVRESANLRMLMDFLNKDNSEWETEAFDCVERLKVEAASQWSAIMFPFHGSLPTQEHKTPVTARHSEHIDHSEDGKHLSTSTATMDRCIAIIEESEKGQRNDTGVTVTTMTSDCENTNKEVAINGRTTEINTTNDRGEEEEHPSLYITEEEEEEEEEAEEEKLINKIRTMTSAMRHTDIDNADDDNDDNDNDINDVLPIVKYHDAILEAIRIHPVVVIQGETGSGKSSQIPKYLMQLHQDNNDFMMVVTQPRRIAAMSLAERVACEIGEPLGHSVGYCIGHDVVANCGPSPSKALFVTTGWLLNKLIFAPEFFAKCSHIVLDEVHERSIDSDLLYVLVRKLLEVSMLSYSKGNSCRTQRVVLMSATIDAQLFMEYFHMSALPIPCLYVGAKRFPVDVIFLEDMLLCPLVASKSGLYPGFEQGVVKLLHQTDYTKPATQEVLFEVCLSLCRMLRAESITALDECCILIFLPGIAEIDSLYLMLAEGMEDDKVELFVLHSTIDREDQLRVFNPVPFAKMRIILSTNIAESSVTIPNVKYVIDFGQNRQLQTDGKTGFTTLQTVWTSQASAQQRTGRCGRLFPGVCFRLYTRNVFELSMTNYEMPELLRMSLHGTILRLKQLAASVGGSSPFCNPRTVLHDTLQPPDDERINASVQLLISGGALTSVRKEYDAAWHSDDGSASVDDSDDPYSTDRSDSLVATAISPLGQFYLRLPMDIIYSKLVAIGARSGRFIMHTLIIAVGLSMPDPFALPHHSAGPERFAHLAYITNKGRRWYQGNIASDCVMLVSLYLEFQRYVVGKDNAAKTRLLDNGINISRLRLMCKCVAEMASKLESSMPKHSRWLNLLNIRQTDGTASQLLLKDLNQQLTMTNADKIFLQYLIALVFVDNGLLHGTVSIDLAAMGFGSRDLLAATAVDPECTVIIRDVPERLLNRDAIMHAFGTKINSCIKLMSISRDVRGIRLPRDTAFDINNIASSAPIAIEFFREEKNEEFVGFNSVLNLPPIAMGAVISMFSKGSLMVKVKGANRDDNDDTVEEQQHQPSSLCIHNPSRLSKCCWTLGGTRKCHADRQSTISQLQGRLGGRDGEVVYAVAAQVTLLQDTARISRMSLIPQSNGAFIIFVLSLVDQAGGAQCIIERHAAHEWISTIEINDRRVAQTPLVLSPLPNASVLNNVLVLEWRYLIAGLLKVAADSEPNPDFNEVCFDKVLSAVDLFTVSETPRSSAKKKTQLVSEQKSIHPIYYD